MTEPCMKHDASYASDSSVWAIIGESECSLVIKREINSLGIIV